MIPTGFAGALGEGVDPSHLAINGVYCTSECIDCINLFPDVIL